MNKVQFLNKSDQAKELFYLATLLSNEVKEMLKEQGGIHLSRSPLLAQRPITEFVRRIRIDGMEKFNGPTLVAFVNFYRNVKEMHKTKVLGALVFYVEEAYLPELLKKLQYPAIDYEDEAGLIDACGTLCNIVAGRFKSAMAKVGYKELEMSPFMSFKNTSINGVPFDPSQEFKQEISYEIDQRKRIVVELTMGPVPHENKK